MVLPSWPYLGLNTSAIRRGRSILNLFVQRGWARLQLYNSNSTQNVHTSKVYGMPWERLVRQILKILQMLTQTLDGGLYQNYILTQPRVT